MSLERKLGLKDAETPVAVAHEATVTVLPVLVLAGLLVGAAFFFLLPLLRLGTLGEIILGVDLVVGLALALGKLVRWRGTFLAVTARRLFIVRRYGLFDRRVFELPLAKVRGVSYRVPGFLPTLFGYGTLTLETSATDAAVELPHLPRPDRLQALLSDLQEQSRAPGDFGEMLQAISRLSDAQLDQLASEMTRTRQRRAGPASGV